MFRQSLVETGRFSPGACVRAAWVFGLCLPVLGSMVLTNAQEWPEPVVVVKGGLEFTLQPSVRTATVGDPVVFYIRVRNTDNVPGVRRRLCGNCGYTVTHESGTRIPNRNSSPWCDCGSGSPGAWLPAEKSVFWDVLLGVESNLKLPGRYTIRYGLGGGSCGFPSVTLETTLDMAEPSSPVDRLAFEAVYTAEDRPYSFLWGCDLLQSQFPTSRYAPYSEWMQWAQELGGPEKAYAGFLRFSQVHPDHPLASWGLLWGYKMAVRRGHRTWALRLETELVTYHSSSPAAVWIRDLYIQ